MTGTGETDRDLQLAALAVATLATVAAIGAVLLLGATATTAVSGGPWHLPPLGTWPGAVLRLASDPSRPGAALPSPWSTPLAAHPTRYWVVTLLLLLLAGLIGGVGGVVVWRRVAPSPPGHATRAEVNAELSAAAARRTARWTRPGLTATERRHAPLTDLAVPLHRDQHRQPLATPLENPTGLIAPTQSGKSRAALVHTALAAPGALLCSSTKPDLFEFTALARTRRGAGPVLLVDATGTVTWPAQLRRSPIRGCTDTRVARRRAHTMVEAGSLDLLDVTGNDKVFRDRATTVLQAYLLAAAHHHRDVTDILRWALGKPPDSEPVTLLTQAGYPELARNLRDEIGMVAETADAVWLSVRRVLEPLMDPHLRWLCTPGPGEQFEPDQFLRDHGTLFLIAGQDQAAQATPILTALVEDLLTTAQDLALTYPARRLDPPATFVLDELTQATPIPQLPAIVADSAGRGVLVHWSAQSRPALDHAYGERRARQLLDNTTTLTIWGGLKDSDTLQWVSTLTGHHDRRRRHHQHDGLLNPGRSSSSTETVPTYRPGDVRTLRRGHVLIIHRHLRPILARTTDVTHRPDWPQLRADVRTIRDGTPPVTTTGHRADPADPPGLSVGPAR